jgi:hypothetical protein
MFFKVILSIKTVLEVFAFNGVVFTFYRVAENSVVMRITAFFPRRTAATATGAR